MVTSRPQPFTCRRISQHQDYPREDPTEASTVKSWVILGPVSPTCEIIPETPPQQWFGDEISEVDPCNTGEPVDSSWLVGGSGNELVLEVDMEGQPHQFLIDPGVVLCIVKTGFSQRRFDPRTGPQEESLVLN